jgi:hypothetical protein
MKMVCLIACLLLSLTTAVGQVSQLKNSDIVDLSKAGLSSESIIAKIKRSECKFETEPGDLVKLRGAGVSSEVIQAMIECEAPKSAPETPTPTPSSQVTTASLAIQAGIVYKIGAPQAVARTAFLILDDDPIKIVTNAGIQGKKPWAAPRMGILESLLFMNMGGQWNDGAAALAALKRHVVASGTTDFNGTLLFTGLPANKRIYIFGIAQTRGGWAVWDLWYEIPAGQVWAGVLDQNNAAIIY